MTGAKDKSKSLPTWKKWLIRIILWGLIITVVALAPRIVGAIVAGLAIFFLIIYWWIIYKLRKLLAPLKDLDLFPAKIKLELRGAPEWHFTDKVKQQEKELQELGFEPIGCYTADKMKGVNIYGFLDTDQSVYAVIYDQQYTGSFLDFFIAFNDNTYITFTNNPQPQIFDRPPGKPIERFPDQGIADLYRTCLEKCPADKQKEQLTKEGFAGIVEKYFAEDRAWQMEHFEESDKMQEAMEEAFLEKSGWSAVEWNRKKNQVIFIHNNLKDWEVVSHYTSGLFLKDDKLYEQEEQRMKKLAREMSPIESFSAALADMPGTKFTELMELHHPVPVAVYLIPTAPEGWEYSD